jgi:hypothetical protein
MTTGTGRLTVCDNCLRQWVEEELGEIEHPEARIDPGSEVPAGECPECGALCYLAHGETERQRRLLDRLLDERRETREVLNALLDWEQMMGGFEAECWNEARKLRHQLIEGIALPREEEQ